MRRKERGLKERACVKVFPFCAGKWSLAGCGLVMCDDLLGWSHRGRTTTVETSQDDVQ